MAKYQDINGSLKPSFKISPTGVELVSGSIEYATSTGVERAKRLFIKKDGENDRVLTEYDMSIPNRAIATYTESQDGQSVIFHLHNGSILVVPKSINTYAGDRYVSNDSDQSRDGNIAVFDGESGRKIKDNGYSVTDNILEDTNTVLTNSQGNIVVSDTSENTSVQVGEYEEGSIPTVGAILDLWGETAYVLWLRRQGSLPKQATNLNTGSNDQASDD